jgi:hypothetical protein
MSAPYWDLRRKVQDKLAAYLVASTGGALVAAADWAGSPTLVPVRAGYTADLVDALPMVAVIADKSSRYVPEVASQVDNTRLVSVRVVIKTSTDEQSGNSGDQTAEEFHAQLVALVCDALNAEDIVTQLSGGAVADCTIQLVDLGDESSETAENTLSTAQEIDVVAIPQ